MTNNSDSNNRSYVPFLLILLFLLIAGFAAVYFLYLKKPHLVYIELPHPLPLSQGDSRQLTAIGIYSDKSKKDISALVTWRSSDPDIADVDNSGFVKSVSTGKTMITATNFETGLSAETTLKVMGEELTDISISPDEESIPPGSTIQFKATGTYANGQTKDITQDVAWESSDRNIAVFQAENQAVGAAVSKISGIVTISARDKISGTTGKTQLTVSVGKLTAIKIAPDDTALPLGSSIQLKAEGTYSDNSKRDITSSVSWTVKNKKKAKISLTDEGIASLVSKATGATTVTAQDPETGLKDEITVTVNKAKMVSIKIIRKKASIPLGSSLQLMARCKFSDGSTHVLQKSVDWQSSNPSVVKFSKSADKKGLAVSKSAGLAVITAKDPKTGIKDTTRLVVKGLNLLSISLSPQDVVLPLGKPIQIRATGKYSDGTIKDITNMLKWSVENPFVLTIGNIEGSKGKIAAFSEGSTVVRATEPRTGVFGKALLTITPPEILSISITPTSPIISLGDTVQLTATGSFSDGSNQNVTDRLNWMTENQQIATAFGEKNGKGRVKGNAEGETVVTAIDTVTGVKAKAGITITSAKLVSISIESPLTKIPLGKTNKLSAIGSYTDNSTSDISHLVEWSCSNNSIAKIDSSSDKKGVLTTLSTGSIVVTATYPAANIKGKADLIVIDSVMDSLVLSPVNPTLYIGKMKQFSATGVYSNGSQKTVTDLVEWSSSDPTIASVRNTPGRKGLANSHAVGIVTITANDPETGVKGSTKLSTRVKW